MGRLELVNELKDLEEKREILEEQLRAIKSGYFGSGTITFEMDTDDFGYDKTKSTTVTFNESLMRNYLELEIEETVEQSKQIIEKLTN